MLICQISDLHIKADRRRSYRVVDTTAALESCLASIRALPQVPDVLVITGDLVDFGRANEYAALAVQLATLDLPTYLLPGNHDERAALRAAFPEHDYLQGNGPIQYVIDRHPVRLVALDTVIPGESGGQFLPAAAEWLDAALSRAPDQPTVVLMHHPPFATGIGHMDDIGLAGSDLLARVIGHHPQVERILCGHLHRSITVRFAGTIASTCPSPAHQVVLDLAPDAASQFVMEPPGFQLHLWRPGAGIVTHTATIGRYPGPYPFYDGDSLID